MCISAAGMIYLPILVLIAILGSYKTNLKLFIVMSALTTIEVIHLGGNGILLYHISFLVIALKFAHLRKWKIKRDKSLLKLFVIYAAISIPFSLLFSGIDIIAVDGGHGSVQFSFQQFTQYAYLLMAYCTYVIVKQSIKERLIGLAETEQTMIFSLALVVAIGFLQCVLPLEFVNTFIRNSAHTLYNYKGARVSSTFSEPSMLALFATPLIIDLAYRLIMLNNSLKIKIGGGILLMCSIALLVMSESSSFIVGCFTGMIVYLCWAIKDKKIRIKSLVRIVFCLLIVIVGGIVFNKQILYNLNSFLVKISVQQNSISGTERMDGLVTSVKAFLKSYLIGVGWGSLRSTDMFSTLLAEVGIVGNVLLYAYILRTTLKLIRIESVLSREIILMQIISFVILCVSVPEIYLLYIWIYWAMGDALLDMNKCSDRQTESMLDSKRKRRYFRWNCQRRLQ